MQITAFKLLRLQPPQDDLKAAIRASKMRLKDGDIIAISSKVVSIGEGRTIPTESTDKEALMKREADWYFKADSTSRYRRYFTIAKGILVGSSGIDESNGSDHYILYPKDPFKSAKQMRTWLQKEYGVSDIAVIITDSTSMMMRRGAIGVALSWDGLDPLNDYRGTKDLFGRDFKIEMANVVDALAAAAVLQMGEGSESTPLCVIRGAEMVSMKNRSAKLDQLMVTPEDDLFAPLMWRKGWKKGGGGTQADLEG